MATTLADIAAAAQKLVEAKRSVSVRSIRGVLGGGSPNVLTALLRQWRQTQLQFPSSSEAPPQMIAEVAGVAPRLWALALEEARVHLQADLDRSMVGLRDANAATDEVQGILDETVQRLEQAQGDRQRSVDALTVIEARCAAAESQVVQSALQAAEALAGLKRQQEFAELLLSKLTVSETARELDAAQLRSLVDKRDREIAGLRTTIAESDAGVAAARKENERLLAELRTQHARAEAREHQVVDLDRQLAVDRATSQEQLGAHRQEVAALRSKNDLLVRQIAEMNVARQALEAERASAGDSQKELGDRLEKSLTAVVERMVAVEGEIAKRLKPVDPSN